MHCISCNTLNDPDACFCSECGNLIAGGPRTPSAKAPRAYLFALLLVPVIAIAGGIGYYKFFLPEGIAAVVNGEEIKRSELDAAVVRAEAADPAATGEGRRTAQDARRLRYEVLSALITERLVLQEARKAGIDIPDGDIAAAVAHAQASSGLDKAGFDLVVDRQYGDGRTFEKAVRRELIIKKFIARKAVPQGGDPQRAGAAMNAWLQDLSARAAVRIALAEQWSGAGGCSGCDSTKTQTAGPQVLNRGCPMSKAASPAGRAGCGRAKSGTSSEPNKKDNRKYAEEAGLKYWHEKYGPGAVSARLIDFGCHIQVDIVKDEKVIGSLRYQNGTITELLQGRR